VDRIVNVDAPATRMAQQLSVEMLQARRPERNYLSPRDSAYLEANRKTIAQMRETLGQIQNLEPEEQFATGRLWTSSICTNGDLKR
jgi:hypothetical protein